MHPVIYEGQFIKPSILQIIELDIDTPNAIDKSPNNIIAKASIIIKLAFSLFLI